MELVKISCLIQVCFTGARRRNLPLTKIGGPGGSGVQSLQVFKNEFVKMFGTDYNFVSFDPRGVGYTGPNLSCGLEERASRSSPLQEQWVQAKANGLYCNRYNRKLNNTVGNATRAGYAGTVANVKDMIHFTELQAKARGRDPAKTKIWYYGVSYGTLIGQTLATLYPNRLGRIILDGNVHGVQHYQGFKPSSVLDTDKTFDFFFKYCYEAGPSLCALARNASCPEDVEERYRNILEKLGAEPYITPNSTDIYTRNEAASTSFRLSYSPKLGFYSIARQMANLGAGDLSELREISDVISTISRDGLMPDAPVKGTDDDLQLITCIDTADRYALKSISAYRRGVDLMFNSSRYGAEAIAYANPLLCNGIDIQPPKSQYFEGFKKTNTSVPILFINNSADPITPMAAAKYMSSFFPGSRILTQDGPGHSIVALPSKCVWNHAKNYLKDATLPKEGTVCKIDMTGKEIFEAGRQRFGAVKAARRSL